MTRRHHTGRHRPRFRSLRSSTDDTVADVVVVGGGITGLTTAYLLAKAGTRVVLLERDRCASADTGHTSAHLTMVTDARLSELVKRFGRDHAQAVWDAGLAAIAHVDEIIREHDDRRRFRVGRRLSHAPLNEEPSAHRPDSRMMRCWRASLDSTPVHRRDSPGVRPGVRFDDQARLHPRKYLAGVAKAFVAAGGRIYEHSAAEEFCDEPLAVKANGHR